MAVNHYLRLVVALAILLLLYIIYGVLFGLFQGYVLGTFFNQGWFFLVQVLLSLGSLGALIWKKLIKL